MDLSTRFTSRILYKILSVICITAVSPRVFSQCTPVNPFAPTQGFGMFVEQNMTVDSKEDKTTFAVGGNFTMTNGEQYKCGSNGVGSYIVSGDALPTSAWIGGKIFGGIGNVNFIKVEGNSFIKVGNTAGVSCADAGNTLVLTNNQTNEKVATTNSNENCSSLSNMGTLNMMSAFATLRNNNSYLASQSSNIGMDATGYFNCVNAINYASLTTAQLNSNIKVTSNADSNHVLIININGGGNTLHVNSNFESHTDPAYSMFNMYNMPAIYFDGLGSNLEFSILAPNTDGFLDQKEMHGQIVFKNLSQSEKNYEHPHNFNGKICLGTATVGDFVWDDQNQNGKQDVGEPGLAGVTVKLYNSAGIVVASATTDAGGHYYFHDVINSGCSTFKVGFSNLPAGYSFTFKNAPGSNGTNNSDVNSASGITDYFTLCAGQTNLDIDAGAFNPGTPLASSLISFQGSYRDGVSALLWTMISDNNLNSFEIERSNDGVNFARIGSTRSIGNSGNFNQYFYNDKLPAVGTNFYRLKILDANGTFKYSNVVLINLSVKGITVTDVYPNPFAEKVQVNVIADKVEHIEIALMDNVSRTIQTYKFTTQVGVNNFTVGSLNSLQKGVYLLIVKAGTDSKVTKLVKD